MTVELYYPHELSRIIDEEKRARISALGGDPPAEPLSYLREEIKCGRRKPLGEGGVWV